MICYCVGLYNLNMPLSDKGYYFTVLMYGLFSAISLQKSVRDQLEGLKVTPIYYGLSWFSTGLAILLLIIGLWNATAMTLAEKGFYGMAFSLAMFAAVAVQKNIRDMALYDDANPKEVVKEEK